MVQYKSLGMMIKNAKTMEKLPVWILFCYKKSIVLIMILSSLEMWREEEMVCNGNYMVFRSILKIRLLTPTMLGSFSLNIINSNGVDFFA